MTRLVYEHDQPHIRSPFATAAPISRLRRAKPLLITTQQRIIIIKPNITMRVGSMKMPSTTRLRLKSIANKLTNIRAVRTLILNNRVFGKTARTLSAPEQSGALFFEKST
jgi:hypothetical protein